MSRAGGVLRRWLAHPMTRGLDIDDPATTILRREIIQKKQFLRRIYQEWYGAIAAALPPVGGPVLELGSGAGFLGDHIPGLISSEVFHVPHVKLVLDAHELPLLDGSLRAIAMVDVLHHLPRPRRFFAEAARCVRPGGAVILIEPWVSKWSRWVFGKVAHEGFEPEATSWEIPAGGPLSSANGAMPWIVFHRDRARFEAEFPQWRIQRIEAGMPFRYVFSGGVGMRSLLPGAAFGPVRRIERRMLPWMASWAMFARIELIRTTA